MLLLNAPVAVALDMRPFKSGSWREILSANAGHAVIVHFWGLTCGPCLEELPKWGTFAASHAKEKIIFVNWDQRQEKPARLATALEQSGLVAAENWALAETFEDKLRFEIDPEWRGEMPYTRMISSDGAVTEFSGSADFGEVSTWLATQDAK